MDQVHNARSGAETDSAPGTRFVADGWTLSLPPGWNDETIYRLDGPTVQGTTVRTVIHVDPDVGEIPVADYAAVRIERQKVSMPDGQILDEGRKQLAPDRTAYRSRVLVPAAETTLLKDQFYVVEEGTGYQFTVTIPQVHYAQFRPVVEWMIQHFEPQPHRQHENREVGGGH